MAKTFNTYYLRKKYLIIYLYFNIYSYVFFKNLLYIDQLKYFYIYTYFAFLSIFLRFLAYLIMTIL